MFDAAHADCEPTPTALAEAISHQTGSEIGIGPSMLLSWKRGLSQETRRRTYHALQLSDNQVSAIEDIVANAPHRPTGKGALDNLVTLFCSKKNGNQVYLESHTVERLYAYRLERDPEVIGYVTQPNLRVVRNTAKGRHISSKTFDFLVFRQDRIDLVECKASDGFRKAAEKSSGWEFNDSTWSNQDYDNAAADLGMRFIAFEQPELFGNELRNVEFIYSHVETKQTDRDDLIGKLALRELDLGGVSLDELASLVPGFTVATAAKMLANRTAFGLERAVSISDTEHFLMFATEVQRDIVENAIFAGQLSECRELDVTSPLLNASEAQLLTAQRRWQRLEEIRQGKQTNTPKMRAVAKRVYALIADGTNPLEACLPRYDMCGNRASRLDPAQRQGIDTVVRRWEKGHFYDREQAFFELERICKAAGSEAPHQSTLNAAIRKMSSVRRTLIRQGVRKFQKNKPRADGSKISLRAVAYGHTLIVDSSNFDQRIAKNLLTNFPSAVPRFYIGIDDATGQPMCHAIYFGSARTDALAMLLREHVRRHGFLPRIIQLDRGPENTSKWIKEFAAHYCIELRWPPTGGSRYNGAAENAIGRVNSAVAHKGPGSTLPDQHGRAFDGRLKSRRTARKCFADIVNNFEEHVYEFMPYTRNSADVSPADVVEDLKDKGACDGTPCSFDDSFLILTSVEVDVPRTVLASKGIRLTEGPYAGTALAECLKNNARVTAIRKDCVDPTTIYVTAGEKWFRAHRRDFQAMLTLSPAERLYELLSEPKRRSASAAANLDQRRKKDEMSRREMEESLPGKDHLMSRPGPHASEAVPPRDIEYHQIDWSQISARVH
ncbi:MAG: transposase family protein [Pseudoxanthomonas suwonensis]|nr:transposase family protein [Pseudoxanthomonas suwonensis]